MHKLIDLHIHSTSSDGIHNPAELVKLAREAGLQTMAIADHDSTAGINEAIEAAKEFDIEVIPAVELSVAYQDYHDVHLLGYWINHNDPAFSNLLENFRQKRAMRGHRIVENINRKLISEGKNEIDIESVLALAGGALGRPHIARVLMDCGHAGSMQEAFTNYLLPCNVPKEYLGFSAALDEIKRIGGVAVLAHPQSISRNRHELSAIIKEMAALGLDGIEALNTLGTDDDDRFLKRLALSLDLAITGGSDFHGSEVGLTMGRGRGNLYLTTELLPALNERRNRRS